MSVLDHLGYNLEKLDDSSRSDLLDRLKQNFEVSFYLESYPDIAESEIDPLEHYVRFGWKEGRDPSPDFSTRYYMEANPSVVESGVIPFVHYITEGKQKNLPGAPDVAASHEVELEADMLAEMDRIRAAFDAEFYLSKYPGVAAAGADPLEHYVRFGWKEGRDPCPDFSTLYYMGANPGVAATGKNPFLHYVVDGKPEGRPGTPDAAKAAEAAAMQEADAEGRLSDELDQIRSSFDAEFYLLKNPGVVAAGLDPLEHFVRFGWKEGRDPNAEFSTLAYLEAHPDVAAAGSNPFLHYILARQARGAPVTAPEVAPEIISAPPAVTDHQSVFDASLDHDLVEDMKAVQSEFDADFYSASYSEVAASGMAPLLHYFQVGWKEGFDPNADFSTVGYLEANTDIATSGVNPFWHYVVAGKQEGRALRPPEQPVESGAPENPADLGVSDIMDAVRTAFDPAFYLSSYPDIAASGIDPLLHYVQAGWQEGRDPSPEFSTQYYLDTNTDIASAGIHPFWHYVVAGKKEGRTGRHPGGYKVDKLINQKPLEEVVLQWRNDAVPDALLDAAQIVKHVLGEKQDGIDRLFVSIGHDNYRAISGGIQVCIQHEENLVASYGGIYLNLHPFQPLPRLAHMDEDPDVLVNLTLGGTLIGTAPMSQMIAAAVLLRDDLGAIDVIVHHPLGHNPEQIAELAQATGQARCWLWLHDFFTICPSFTLQRNGITFCNAPDLGSNACTLCLYGRERAKHQKRMQAFFEAVDVNVLSPSQVTADLWSAQAGLNAASLEVCPHMTLDWAKRKTPAPTERDEITIAFLGTPAPHKGWAVYDRLVREFHTDSRFRFVYCGSSPVPNSAVSHVPVHVTAETPDAMIEAVAEEQADLVLHWASWPETFSLSTYEALAGGAYVLTNTISGNVAATVDRLKRGAVLQDEADLEAFFEDGRVEKMVTKLRKERAGKTISWTISDMSMPLTQNGARK